MWCLHCDVWCFVLYVVVALGFVGEEDRVVEGSGVMVCASLRNITLDNFQRSDDIFPVSTEDGNATG